MKDYLKPDNRWKHYKFDNQRDYIEKVVIRGYFHQSVPDDVVKAFTTSEYLMAHAYFHWELFDEALKKCLFTLEMAVKIRAEEKGIDLVRKNKKGRRFDRRLVDVIKDVCKEPHLGHVKEYLNKARELRNIFAHPKEHSFSGPLSTSTYIVHVVNVINRLFRADEWHKEYAENTKTLGSQLDTLNKKVLKVETDRPAFLISRIHSFELIEDNLILSVVPVLNKYEISDKSITCEDIVVYTILNFQVNESAISGSLVNGEAVNISVSNHPDNQKALVEVKNYVDQLTDEQAMVNNESLEYKTSVEFAKTEYLCYKRSFG